MKIASNWNDVEFFMHLHPFYLESPKSNCQSNSTGNGFKDLSSSKNFLASNGVTWGKLLNHSELLLTHLESVDNDILLLELAVKLLRDNLYESSYIVADLCYIMFLINVDMILGQLVCLNHIVSDSKSTRLNYPFKTRTIGQVLRGWKCVS